MGCLAANREHRLIEFIAYYFHCDPNAGYVIGTFMPLIFAVYKVQNQVEKEAHDRMNRRNR